MDCPWARHPTHPSICSAAPVYQLFKFLALSQLSLRKYASYFIDDANKSNEFLTPFVWHIPYLRKISLFKFLAFILQTEWPDIHWLLFYFPKKYWISNSIVQLYYKSRPPTRAQLISTQLFLMSFLIGTLQKETIQPCWDHSTWWNDILDYGPK